MSIHRATTWLDIPSDWSISELIESTSANIPPEKIVYEEAFTGSTITYGQFTRNVRRAAYWLKHELGLKEGQIVLISGPSCIQYILAVHSIWRAGGVVSLVNNSLHNSEIAKALEIVGPDFLLVHDTMVEKMQQCQRLRGEATATPTLSFGRPHKSLPSFTSHVQSETRELGLFSLANREAHGVLAAILLSSGTTGRPKAVMLSHRNLVAAVMQMRADNPANWRQSQREIFFPPLSHVYALYVCMTGCLWVGAYVCLMPRFHLETYCRLMQDRDATLARLVPPIAKQLGDNKIVRKYKYPKLEYFSCSAAPLNHDTAEKLAKVFPHVALCQTYGATELSGPCMHSGRRDIGMPLTAVGTLIANTEMVFLQEDGISTRPRGPGEITVRGPNIMMGYKDDASATADTIIPGGWCRTGDLGYMDKNGFIVVNDRIKDTIKYNGFQVSPLELEEILIKHPLVDEAAVIGSWSDTHASDLPRAFIVRKKSPGGVYVDPAEAARTISTFLSERVSNYKQLKGGIVFTDQLPKNPTGKVLRRVLRDQETALNVDRVLAKL